MDALAACLPFGSQRGCDAPRIAKDGEQQLEAAGTGTLPRRGQVAPVGCSCPGGLQPLSVASGGAPRDVPGDRAAVAAAPQPLQFAAPQRGFSVQSCPSCPSCPVQALVQAVAHGCHLRLARIGRSAACRSPNVMQPKGDFVASTRHGPAETCNLHLLESLPHSAFGL